MFYCARHAAFVLFTRSTELNISLVVPQERHSRQFILTFTSTLLSDRDLRITSSWIFIPRQNHSEQTDCKQNTCSAARCIESSRHVTTRQRDRALHLKLWPSLPGRGQLQVRVPLKSIMEPEMRRAEGRGSRPQG